MINCNKYENQVKFVKSDSIAEKNGLEAGDFLIKIDNQSIMTYDDIKNAIRNKEECKITILRGSTEKIIYIDNVKDFIKSIEFEKETVYSNCEKKTKPNKFLLIITPICIVLIISVIAITLVKKTTTKKNKDEKSTITTLEQRKKVIKETAKQNIFLMDEQTKKKLIKEIEQKKQELPTDEKMNTPRVESIINENFELDNFDKELKKELEKLYDEQNKEDDDNPFGDYGSNNSPNEKENKGGPGLGKNDTLSDKPAEEKAIRVFFNYGSHLEANGFSMAKYLKGNQTIETAADIEYAEFCIAINDLIKSIPDEKRNKATFSVVGYTDTSFRNKIPDKGEESQLFNRELSLKRANSVVKILRMEVGIDSNKILAPKGRGFENLIRENGKENHEKSRRVEIYCLWK